MLDNLNNLVQFIRLLIVQPACGDGAFTGFESSRRYSVRPTVNTGIYKDSRQNVQLSHSTQVV